MRGGGGGGGSGPVFTVHSLLTTLTETINSTYAYENISCVPMDVKHLPNNAGNTSLSSMELQV